MAEAETYLGFDFGTRRIGVAVGQRLTGTASPLETIRSERKAMRWQAIDRLVRTWRPAGFVVGIALRDDGGDNPVTPLMRRFCRQLEGRYHRPVHVVDEHLTSRESRRLLFEDLGLRAGKVHRYNDQVAARLILETWLNHQETPA